MNDLATMAYPCKRNQEHKKEQKMQSNKPMNGDIV
jgi:hypothetical protein